MKRFFNGIYCLLKAFWAFVKEMWHRYCRYVEIENNGNFFDRSVSARHGPMYYLMNSDEERQRMQDEGMEEARYIVAYWNEIQLENDAQWERREAMKVRRRQKRKERRKARWMKTPS